MVSGVETAGEFRVLRLDEVDSTNNVVKRALRDGEASGLVVRAWRQTGGYGRQGRSWTSPEGGLYCSWLLRPSVEPAALPTLSLVVGLALRRALASLAGDSGDRILVKWPNDVVLAGEGESPEGPSSVRAEAPSLVLARSGAKAYDLSPLRNRSGTSALPDDGHAADSNDSLLPLRNRSGASTPAPDAREKVSGSSDGRPKMPERLRSGNGLQLEMSGRARTSEGVFGRPPDEPAGSGRGFRKLVGISLEAVAGGVCVGTGVNVVRPGGAAVSVGGKNVAGYMADVAPGLVAEGARAAVDRVFDAVAASLGECYGLWLREGFGAFADEFDGCHVLAGAAVGVVDREGNPIGHGVVRRVDEQGCLVLADADGTECRIASGEAHIV